MVHFVIAGKPDCKNMVQVMNVVYYLKDNLPSFEFRKIELAFDEWSAFLVRVNREYKWHHSESPIVYKEIFHYGCRKPILIGGISEFWEYCYDYYGLECIMNSSMVNSLVGENMKFFTKDYLSKYSSMENTRNIMIYGATNPMTTILLPQFMQIEDIEKLKKVRFILYDETLRENGEEFFEEFNSEFRSMYGARAVYCDNLAEGLKDSHLLIVVDDTTNLATDADALSKYILQIFFLAEEINQCGNRDLRIIFANSGLSCLIATILARRIIVPHSQIVVVSSDFGLSYLGEVSRRLDIPMERFAAPPVWGFVGLNEFVDVGSCLMKCNVYKPFKRAIRATPNSTLTHGTMYSELRFINYLTDDIKDLDETVQTRRQIVKDKLKRAPMLAKLEALINLIRIWYGCTTLKEPIISLGVMSDGSFSIPERIMFSQPAIQFRDGWIPYSKYPVPEHVLKRVALVADEAERYYYQHCESSQPVPTETYVSLHKGSKYKSFHQQRSHTAPIQ